MPAFDDYSDEKNKGSFKDGAADEAAPFDSSIRL
jgi:hypothetical protein